MSFQDLTPRGTPRGMPPQGLEFEGRNGVHPRSRPRPQRPRPKSPIKRSVSNSNAPSSTRHRPASAQSAFFSQRQGVALSRSKSDVSHMSRDAALQSLLVQQREEEYAMRTMREREEEMRDVHRKMHVVNEIYKDLGEVVGQQQEQIDEIEDHFRGAADSTRRGLDQIEKANGTHEKVAEDADQSVEEGFEFNKRNQISFLYYLSKGMGEMAKLLSVCGGSGSASYVEGESWVKKL